MLFARPFSALTIVLVAGLGLGSPALVGTTLAEDGGAPSETTAIEIPQAQPSEVTEAPAVGESIRIAGEPTGPLLHGGEDFYRVGACRIDTALPEGYPAPTAPECVEVKTYPVVRRAEVSGKSAPDLGMNFGFWRLFQHIQSRDIAMTSPVEMDYGLEEAGAAANETRPDLEWTMSFLYRTPTMGTTGPGSNDGRVAVVDRPVVTVLSIGMQGTYRADEVLDQIEELRSWVALLPDWEVAGEPRGLFYNGPNVRASNRWAEAQLPIRRVPPEKSEGTSTSDVPETTPADPPEREVFLR